MGIPTNTRLRKDIDPILNDGLQMESATPGMFKSPFLEGVDIVEAKTTDLVRLLRERLIDMAFIADDIGFEETARIMNLEKQRELLESATSNGVFPLEAFEKAEAEGRLARWNDSNLFGLRDLQAEKIERCLGFDLVDSPVLRALVRKEDRELDPRSAPWAKLDTANPYAVVTSYPELYKFLSYYRSANSVEDLEYKIPPTIKVNGNVEAYLRNGVYPNAAIAVDLVQTGKTATENGLVALRNRSTLSGRKSLDSRDRTGSSPAEPSIWRMDNVEEGVRKRIEDLIAVIEQKVKDANFDFLRFGNSGVNSFSATGALWIRQYLL